MKTPRCIHTATLLPTGKLLVVGGMITMQQGATSEYELYDPSTEKWTIGGNIEVARLGHTASLLPNGEVLIAGGFNLMILHSAELYDPKTNVWKRVNSMHDTRFGHTASVLPNGKVLVTGGYKNALGNYRDSCELYDPSTGNWSMTGKMHNPRAWHTATVLLNGKVLVAGGDYEGFNDPPISVAELYDPLTGNWTITDNMNVSRYCHTASLLKNGQVLVTGACRYYDHRCESAELYNPSTGSWTLTNNMHECRQGHAATVLPNGQVLVAAGNIDLGNMDGTSEVFDPATGTWTESPMNENRFMHTISVLPNGKVLAAGRCDINYIGYNSTELYDPTISHESDTVETFIAEKYRKASMNSMVYNSSKEAVMYSDEKKRQKILRKRIIPIKKLLRAVKNKEIH
mgnify:FL=1